MTDSPASSAPSTPRHESPSSPARSLRRVEGPLPNYSLSSVCPQCAHPTVRRACKVRCDRCGFMWDCSEL